MAWERQSQLTASTEKEKKKKKKKEGKKTKGKKNPALRLER